MENQKIDGYQPLNTVDTNNPPRQLKNTSFEDLMCIIDNCANVKEVKYNNFEKNWIIKYKSGMKPDVVESKDLIDFLENA